jgi:hypothetical protein
MHKSRRSENAQENDPMMAERKTLTKKPAPLEEAPEAASQRKRPETGQFRLQVDRQTKASYATSEEAEAAGLIIKKGHPIVHVTVYDIKGGMNKVVELTGAVAMAPLAKADASDSA